MSRNAGGDENGRFDVDTLLVLTGTEESYICLHPTPGIFVKSECWVWLQTI